MMTRSQISLDPELHRRAQRRAAEQGISFAEYVRSLVRSDLMAEPRPKADISAIFDLGDSGGSDVGVHKHEYIGEAVDAAHPRR